MSSSTRGPEHALMELPVGLQRLQDERTTTMHFGGPLADITHVDNWVTNEGTLEDPE